MVKDRSGSIEKVSRRFRRCSGPGRGPGPAVLLERAHLRDGACPDPLPCRFVDLLQRGDRERHVLADHVPVLRGRLASRARRRRPTRRRRAAPRASYRALTNPGAAHRNMFGPSGSGAPPPPRWRSPAWRSMSTGSPRARPTPTSRAVRPARARARTRRSPWPCRGRTCSRSAPRRCRRWRRRTAGRRRCTPSSRRWRALAARARRAATSSISGDEVGEHDAAVRDSLRDAQAGLARAGGDVEVLLILSDVETLDHRGADRAQLLHDDRVPLVPARGEPAHVARWASRISSALAMGRSLCRGDRRATAIGRVRRCPT